MIEDKISISDSVVFWGITLLDEMGGICGAHTVVHPLAINPSPFLTVIHHALLFGPSRVSKVSSFPLML